MSNLAPDFTSVLTLFIEAPSRPNIPPEKNISPSVPPEDGHERSEM